MLAPVLSAAGGPIPDSIAHTCGSFRPITFLLRTCIHTKAAPRHPGKLATLNHLTALLQDWLIRMGVDAPKPPRPSRATLDTVRRRQVSNLYRPPPQPHHHHHHYPPQQAQQAGAAAAAPLNRAVAPVAGSARAAGASVAGPRTGKQVRLALHFLASVRTTVCCCCCC